MVIKRRKVPTDILKLEALLRRLPRNHPKYRTIEDTYMRKRAGFQGELSLDYYLGFLPENHLILHDIRLHEGKRYFQIDCLILTHSYVLILEVKNFSGTVIFDTEFNQMIRVINDKEEGFSNPILQVERQKENLKNWFSNHNISLPPIETIVIISNPQTIIKATANPVQISQNVIHSASLMNKIERFAQKHKLEKMPIKDLKRLSRLILRKHEAQETNLLEKNQIPKNEIMTGVHCTSCLNLKMSRIHGCWTCLICKHNIKDAHLASLKDYALLISPFITNQEARRFLEIDSITITSRLLSSSNLNYSGKLKGRKYELQHLIAYDKKKSV